MGFQVNEVQRVLKGAEYPMNGEQLAKLAKQNGASQDLVDELADIDGADYPMNGEQLAALAENNGGPSELVERLRDLSEADGPSSVMKQLKEHLGGKPAKNRN